ncbi:MAG: co-chaperone DjlA [Congregibacter sp.]
MFIGKLVAACLGLVVAGFPGLIFGLVVGHLFDAGVSSVLGFGGAGLGDIKQRFFRTTFLLMGHLAKADGRVSKEEIAHTEQVFRQLGLGDEQRHEAILLFKQGTEPEFSVESTVRVFLQTGGAHPALKQTLLVFLIALALADQQVDAAERACLQRIGELLGYSDGAVDELLRMATAQGQFHQGAAASSNAPTLSDAYAALGVSAEAPDKEVKRAYRKLMSENHPDKLSARGVPEDMLKLATERAQDIQAAYELVRQTRGMSKSSRS